MSTYGVLATLVAELRVARALVNDQIRGTNDRKCELVRDWDNAIEEGQREMKAVLADTNKPHL